MKPPSEGRGLDEAEEFQKEYNCAECLRVYRPLQSAVSNFISDKNCHSTSVTC